MRTTIAELKKIFETTLTDDELTAFMTTASTMVDTYLSDKGVSDSVLTQIETYLAAHVASLRERQLSFEAAGASSATYQGTTGDLLTSTNYGQTAIMLDPSDTLRTLGKLTAKLEVL